MTVKCIFETGFYQKYHIRKWYHYHVKQMIIVGHTLSELMKVQEKENQHEVNRCILSPYAQAVCRAGDERIAQ